MERKYTGGVEVIKRQTAELAFRFDGTEWNGNVTVLMPPTVNMKYTHLLSILYLSSVQVL